MAQKGRRFPVSIGGIAELLNDQEGAPEQITSVSIEMSRTFTREVTEYLPAARTVFEEFRVIVQASAIINETSGTDPSLMGCAGLCSIIASACANVNAGVKAEVFHANGAGTAQVVNTPRPELTADEFLRLRVPFAAQKLSYA